MQNNNIKIKREVVLPGIKIVGKINLIHKKTAPKGAKKESRDYIVSGGSGHWWAYHQ